MRRGSTPVGAFDVPALDDNEEEDDYKPRHQVKSSVDSNKDQSNRNRLKLVADSDIL